MRDGLAWCAWPSLTGWLYLVGYVLLAACYAPQWIAIFSAPKAAVEGVSPVFLGAVTAGLICLQVALVRDQAHPALRWGNLAALANALVTDCAWFWALLRALG
ncbi:MAG: hypothetical protein K9K34_18975 [Desulfarculaceae bacterium]|nr:hypothetical protein [Desulfarculaceae bacterium]